MSTPVASADRRRGPWRWLVALLATVLLVVSGSGLVAFAQSGSGANRGPAFVPADAPIYIVGRLDMPAGQGEALAQFMTAFPGFADAASFELKSDQLIDGLVKQVTGGALSFDGDVQSFLTGEIGLAVMNFIEAAMGGGDPDIIAGIAISDRAAAQSFVDALVAEAPDAAQEAYGSTSVIFTDQLAIAVHDEWILAGQTADQVKAGIDVLDGTTASLADDAQFAAAFARVPAAHLAAAYMNLQSFGSLIDLAGAAAGGQAGLNIDTAQMMEQLPLDMTAYLAASADRLTLEAFITPSEQAMTFAEGESDLAEVFPADTQIYGEMRELGMTLETALEALLMQLPEEQLAQLPAFEDMLDASLPEFFDFVSDAAAGASINSDGLWLGIAAEVTDDELAAARAERLMSLVRFAAIQDPTITVETSTLGEHSVTTVTLPVEDMAGAAGAGVPIDIPDTVSITVADGMLLVGTGDFVAEALEISATDSLAASPGYIDALGEDTANAGVLYANVGALLAELDPMLGLMTPQWADIQPYATAIDRFVAVGTVDEVISTKMSVITDS